MTTREMSNIEVVNAMKFMDGSIKEKKLPIKLSYAIRRSMTNLKAAYEPYIDSLNKLCEDYGCTPDKLYVDDKEKQKEMNHEINDLLAEKTEVQIHTVDFDIIEQCGQGNYDPLTYEEVDGLWWLIDDET